MFQVVYGGHHDVSIVFEASNHEVASTADGGAGHPGIVAVVKSPPWMYTGVVSAAYGA